jgi:hypothetical protein
MERDCLERKPRRAGDGQMVMFAPDGDEVRIENSADSKAAARSVANRWRAFE